MNDVGIFLNGAAVSQKAVRAWEARRISAVSRRFNLPVAAGNRDEQLAVILRHKRSLGHDGLHKFFARDLKWSERMVRLIVRLSRGKRKFSICEIHVAAGSAEQFVHWFQERGRIGDEAAMLNACPDHHIIDNLPDGRQLVLETTGGSLFASEFLVDYDDQEDLRSERLAEWPLQMAGVARLHDGLAIGGVRHQFRQVGDGFQARCLVEFPSFTPGFMISQHQWHLAVEFSNWIGAALQASQQEA